tara:strand:- start:4119 stop:5210 length:1092 start_codon:yes stop_codon:yes gene_type:complete
MAATLKTDVVGNKTDSTANLTLGSSGATTFGGAITITSGTINGTTIGASTATTGKFTDVTATNIQATSGQTLSLKEDSGSAVITIDTSGDVVVNPATSSGTISVGTANTQSVVQDAKIAGTGYQSGATSAGVGLGVGKVFVGITGEIRMYGGSSAPEGWVLCDGARYDGTAGTAYKNLYDVLGTAYGDGDGTSNDFNVPDMRGRVPLGVGTGVGLNASSSSSGQDPATGSGSTLTARNRGAYGGVESVTLTGAQSGLKAHEHTVPGATTNSQSATTTGNQNANHGHTYQRNHLGGGAFGSGSNYGTGGEYSSTTGNQNASHGHDYTHTHTTPSRSTTGGSAQDAASAHSNEMPFMCVNYIIKL